MKKLKGFKRRWYMFRDLIGLHDKQYNYKNNYTFDEDKDGNQMQDKKIFQYYCDLIGHIEQIEQKLSLYNQCNYDLKGDIEQIEKKLSLYNDIVVINGVKVFVPNYPLDWIQKTIVNSGNFYEINYLKSVDKYLNKDSIILDIGANIGNHTLYWSKITNAKKIYSFEPVDITFSILKKNIEINKLENKVVLNNIGLCDKDIKANAEKYDINNIGETPLKEESDGSFTLTTLDNYIKNNFKEEKIDFIKIDTEGFEYKILLGARETIKKYKPMICTEIFSDKFNDTNDLLEKYGYKLKEKVKSDNYLYVYEK